MDESQASVDFQIQGKHFECIKIEPENIDYDLPTEHDNECIQTIRVEIGPEKNKFHRKVKCNKCNEYILSYIELINHINEKRHQELYCHLCPTNNFSLVIDILNHLKFKHDIDQTSNEVFVCLKSQLKFKETETNTVLQLHNFKVSCFKTCLLCCKRVSDLSALWDHTNENHNYCRACCKSFKNYNDLVRHEFKHLEGEIKIYYCIECNEKFMNYQHLVEHGTYAHKNENVVRSRVIKLETDMDDLLKSYSCPYCSILIHSVPSLEEHILLHTAYRCNTCNNVFLGFNLQANPEQCTFCDMSIQSSQSMKKTEAQQKTYEKSNIQHEPQNIKPDNTVPPNLNNIIEYLCPNISVEATSVKTKRVKRVSRKQKEPKQLTKRKSTATTKVRYKHRIEELQRKNAMDLLSEMPEIHKKLEERKGELTFSVPKVLTSDEQTSQNNEKITRTPYHKRMTMILGTLKPFEKIKRQSQKIQNVTNDEPKPIFHGIPCIFCSNFSGASLQVYRHVQDVHNICRICMVEFSSLASYKKHEKKHNKGLLKFFQCVHCRIYIKTAKEYRKHLDEGHNHITRQSKKCQKVERKIPEFIPDRVMANSQCPFCCTLTSTQAFMDHLKAKHNIYQCDKCHDNFVAKTCSADPHRAVQCDACNTIIDTSNNSIPSTTEENSEHIELKPNEELGIVFIKQEVDDY